MCTHRTLSQGDYGYIIYCLKCKHYQLCFGTSLIRMSATNYASFYEVATEQFTEQKNSGMERHKNIQLPTFSRNNLMVLSYVELCRLMEMLKEAAVMNEVYAILDERKINQQ